MRTVITTTNSLSVRSVRNVSIDIANESGWEGYEESLVSQAEFVLERLRIHPQAELSLVFVDEDAMSV